jgi:flagellar basal-body rod modification protein FlgD
MSDGATSIKNAAQQQVDYLSLLITQMKNQDPMNPMDNAQMSMQLAQFSQLQQTEQLNTSFKDVLQTTQMNYGESLIGRQITYVPDGGSTPRTTQVTGMSLQDGQVVLQADKATVAVKDVPGLSGQLKGLSLASQVEYLSALIGQTVAIMPSGTTTVTAGTVTGVTQTAGQVQIAIARTSVPVDGVLSVSP